MIEFSVVNSTTIRYTPKLFTRPHAHIIYQCDRTEHNICISAGPGAKEGQGLIRKSHFCVIA